MLNNDENTLTNDVLDKLHTFLDVVESSEGPACLVTIGTGSRFFSTGFNLGFWANDFKNMLTSGPNFHKLYAKLLTLNVPTLAVVNGHAYAGGLLLAISHDFRIMQDAPKRKICLSELKLGGPLGISSNALC